VVEGGVQVSTLFLDIENNEDELLLVGWALDEGNVRVEQEPMPPPRASQFMSALADPTVTKVTQSDHDLRWFLMHGHEVAGPWHDTKVMAWRVDENQPLDLGSLVARYTDGHAKEKHIRQVQNRLAFVLDGEHWWLDRHAEWPDKVKARFAAYCANDVETLRELYRALARALMASERVGHWRDEEVPYSSVLLRMECRGLPVNLADTKALADEVRAERDRASAHLRKTARLPDTFNLNSPKQVREYLFSRWFTIPDALPMDTDPLPSDQDFEITKVGRTLIHGVWTLRGRGLEPTDPPKRKDREDDEDGEPSTASPELLYKHPQDPWVRELCLDYRRNAKLLGTYLDKFPKVAVEDTTRWHYVIGADGEPIGKEWDTRIYGRFNQTGTVTGRLSSSSPNLQNIPARREVGKKVRALFQGNLVIGDYDALEMRLMAHFSRDPKLVNVFATGGDPHALTAVALFGACDGHEDPRRDIAKTVNYAIGYGAGAKKLAQTLTLAGFGTTFAEAKEYLRLIQDFYPVLYRWKDRVIWRAKDTGMVESISGRARHLTGLRSDEVASWKQTAYGERQAVNAIIQGSAADILRRVMLEVDHFEKDFRLIAQVHDELLWEYMRRPDAGDLRVLQDVCENGHGYKLRVPLTFEPMVCSDWSQKGEGIDLSALTEEED
jgi:DNA polymerase I-like protein with 3'-5' exonuclease and polymerase domains